MSSAVDFPGKIFHPILVGKNVKTASRAAQCNKSPIKLIPLISIPQLSYLIIANIKTDPLC